MEEKFQVCRGCVQFLRLMLKRPVLEVEKLNPYLFTHVEELPAVKVRSSLPFHLSKNRFPSSAPLGFHGSKSHPFQMLREDLQQMKQYLTNCHIARSKKLLWLLNKRHHFVENSQMYSMQDLQDLEAGTLIKYLQQVVKVYEAHITKECEVRYLLRHASHKRPPRS